MSKSNNNKRESIGQWGLLSWMRGARLIRKGVAIFYSTQHILAHSDGLCKLIIDESRRGLGEGAVLEKCTPSFGACVMPLSLMSTQQSAVIIERFQKFVRISSGLIIAR